MLVRPRLCVPGHVLCAASPGPGSPSVTSAAHRAVQVAKGTGGCTVPCVLHTAGVLGPTVPSRGSHCPFLSLISPVEKEATLGAM